jgi:hypothetical protein
MNIPSTGNVYFFESQKDIDVSGPYATISAEELSAIIKRFVSWAAMVATYPDLAETFGDANTAHIKLATELRNAMKVSRQGGIYPNVVLPICKFRSVMTLMRISRLLESEMEEMIAHEHQKWEDDLPF